MDWSKFFKVFIRNSAITILLAVAILGILGFLIAGKEGLINGIYWGFLLSFISVPFMAVIIFPKYWGDYAGRYGEWYVKKETEGENQRPE